MLWKRRACCSGSRFQSKAVDPFLSEPKSDNKKSRARAGICLRGRGASSQKSFLRKQFCEVFSSLVYCSSGAAREHAPFFATDHAARKAAPFRSGTNLRVSASADFSKPRDIFPRQFAEKFVNSSHYHNILFREQRFEVCGEIIVRDENVDILDARKRIRHDLADLGTVKHHIRRLCLGAGKFQ